MLTTPPTSSKLAFAVIAFMVVPYWPVLFAVTASAVLVCVFIVLSSKVEKPLRKTCRSASSYEAVLGQLKVSSEITWRPYSRGVAPLG